MKKIKTKKRINKVTPQYILAVRINYSASEVFTFPTHQQRALAKKDIRKMAKEKGDVIEFATANMLR